MVRLAFIATPLALLAACSTWATPESTSLSLKVPAQVARGEDFTFEAELRGPEGEPLPGVKFKWSVDWPQLKGAFHVGATSEPQTTRAKGAGGKGLLRIYGINPEGGLVQLAKAEFDVN